MSVGQRRICILLCQPPCCQSPSHSAATVYQTQAVWEAADVSEASCQVQPCDSYKKRGRVWGGRGGKRERGVEETTSQRLVWRGVSYKTCLDKHKPGLLQAESTPCTLGYVKCTMLTTQKSLCKTLFWRTGALYLQRLKIWHPFFFFIQHFKSCLIKVSHDQTGFVPLNYFGCQHRHTHILPI